MLDLCGGPLGILRMQGWLRVGDGPEWGCAACLAAPQQLQLT